VASARGVQANDKDTAVFDQDPLEQWLISTSIERKPDPREQQLLYDDLDTLARWLTIPVDVRPKAVPRVWGGVFRGARLAKKDLLPVQQIYRQLLVTKGTGKSHVEPSLIALLAYALDPATIPFFVELLALPNRSGDSFANQRRTLALGGLAFLAYQTDDQQAIAALMDATQHALPFVRAQAIHCLEQIIVGIDTSWISSLPKFGIPKPEETNQEPEETNQEPLRREPTAAILARLAEIARSDPAFQPRFMARSLLAELDQPAPLEYPGGTYTFKVAFKHAKNINRTIEVQSEQSLEDLHRAIQSALQWDNDHLYSFFLNGNGDDPRYRFASPFEDDEPQWTTDGIIGELGLTLKHTFLYLFDYGDSHEFEVQVVGITAQAEPGEYPRVIASMGESPRQYIYADDNDEDY
jgi:hypothetical protein